MHVVGAPFVLFVDVLHRAMQDVQGFSHSGLSTVETYHTNFPTKPEFMSECCSCNTQRGEDVYVGASIEESFNGACIAGQTNTSNGLDHVVGSMVWTLFDYFGTVTLLNLVQCYCMFNVSA
jgi:hypothetical protein